MNLNTIMEKTHFTSTVQPKDFKDLCVPFIQVI